MSKYTSSRVLTSRLIIQSFCHPIFKFLHVPWLTKVVAMISKGFFKMTNVVFPNFEQFERK